MHSSLKYVALATLGWLVCAMASGAQLLGAWDQRER